MLIKTELAQVAADGKRFSIISPHQASTLGNYYKQLLETRWTWEKVEREFGVWPLGMIILNRTPAQSAGWNCLQWTTPPDMSKNSDWFPRNSKFYRMLGLYFLTPQQQNFKGKFISMKLIWKQAAVCFTHWHSQEGVHLVVGNWTLLVVDISLLYLPVIAGRSGKWLSLLPPCPVDCGKKHCNKCILKFWLVLNNNGFDPIYFCGWKGVNL